MTVNQVMKMLSLKVLAGYNGLDKLVSGCYCCDLLSWVMSHAEAGNVWITIQTHSNIVAVAMLTDVSCIIIPEGIAVENDTLLRADEHCIPILSSKENGYEIAGKLYNLGI